MNLYTMSLNQIEENLYCNSESYNPTYDKNYLETRLQTINSWVNGSIIQPNLHFFSNMLKINIVSSNRIPPHYQYHDRDERSRRGLQISVRWQPRKNKPYVIFSITYQYRFDYHSPGKHYMRANKETINNRLCECIQDLGNDMYIFQADSINLFHFTFHSPAPKLPKELKIKGAFHLNIDSFAAEPPHIVPYRPFLVDPRTSVPGTRTHFLTWDAFPGTDGYFTSTMITGMEELSSFVRENPTITMVHTVRGQPVHYLEDIVKPIYDKVVTDVLDPLIAGLPGHAVPAAVKYDPLHSTVACHRMRTLKIHAKQERTLRQQGRDMWMGGRRRTKKRTSPT